MAVLVKIIYLIAQPILTLYIYDWSAVFKKMGISTAAEINEGETKEADLVDESEAKYINYVGSFIFIFIGSFLWGLLGITVGKITTALFENTILTIVIGIILYFVFLRIPFGAGNKMIVKSYDLPRVPEKNIFAIVMITLYVLAICCFEKLPQFMTFHLYFLK